MQQISITRILELFTYNPNTGVISRAIGFGRAYKGQTFQSTTIKVDGIWIRTGRLAWALHNKAWPPNGYYIDHKNGIKSDNRITNLRLATPRQNQQNIAGHGFYSKGVTWRDRIDKPWQSNLS